MKKLTTVQYGFRVVLTPGSSMIGIWLDTEIPGEAVPYDMVDLPGWVNRAKVDDECLHILFHRWLSGRWSLADNVRAERHGVRS